MRFFVLPIFDAHLPIYAGIHHSKYWMPIHYDTIEDGQNKKSHILFSFLVRIVLFLPFIGGGFVCQKYYYIISLVSFE